MFCVTSKYFETFISILLKCLLPCIKITFMAIIKLEDKIDKARGGITQAWLVRQMITKGIPMTTVKFTRKKKGKSDFTKRELKILSTLLSTDLSK